MLDMWGPIINRGLAGTGIFCAFFASMFWLSGHVEWLILNNREPPDWMSEWFEKGAFKKPRHRNVFITKGIAWIINIFAILWSLGPGVDSSFKPIIGDIMLASIGGAIFELTLFFVITGFFQWTTRER